MKKKHRNQKVVVNPVVPEKPKRRPRQMAWLIVGVLAVAVGLWAVLYFGKKETIDYTVEYILAKVTPTPVCQDKVPVLIFRYSDDNIVSRQANGMEKIQCALAGSGTMVKMQNGEYQIITAEHVFSVHGPAGYQAQKYMVQVLREGGNVVTRNLADARPSLGKPGLADVAECKVSLGNKDKIAPFSPFFGHDDGVETYTEYTLCIGKPEDKVVRSLVSGETATLLCMDEIPGTGGMQLFLVDYDSIPGESGTGFVDRYGNLFVLKSSLDKGANGVEITNKKLREIGVISEDKKGFSYLTGFFKINPGQK
jgi:hypothetical protein